MNINIFKIKMVVTNEKLISVFLTRSIIFFLKIFNDNFQLSLLVIPNSNQYYFIVLAFVNMNCKFNEKH